MPPDEWEIVLVDDMSTEDLRLTYQHLIGKINLLHVNMDHTKHPIYLEMNPSWSEGEPTHWYHTPAISTNIGGDAAQGQILCICHPEILHDRDNFARAYDALSNRKSYLFGKTHLGTLKHNEWLEKNAWHQVGAWADFITLMQTIDPVGAFGPSELYWYTSFLPREAFEKIRGVDCEYLRGAAAEDDDFRERARSAGWPPVFTQNINGFHQDHSDEQEMHRRRDTQAWHEGLARNRARYYAKVKEDAFAQQVNLTYDWAGRSCVIGMTRYVVGTLAPEVIPASRCPSPEFVRQSTSSEK